MPIGSFELQLPLKLLFCLVLLIWAIVLYFKWFKDICFKKKLARKDLPEPKAVFVKPSEDDYIKHVCNRLRITTQDFSRAGCVTVPPDEATHYDILNKSLAFRLASGKELNFEWEAGWILISYDPEFFLNA